MKKLLILSLTVAAVGANAGTLFFDGILDGTSPRYNNGTGGGNNAYMAAMIMVDTTGLYTIETASPNTSTGISNALDTYLRLFPSTWVPANGITGAIASNDDYTGVLGVLPGPYAGTVGPNGTGFTGAQPASRLLNVNLTANTQYWLVNTSFRTWNYVNTGTEGRGVGHFYTGISGVGNIVPEPGTFVAIGLGLAGLALARRRK